MSPILRRRFAFVTLEPALNEAWRAWCTKLCNFDPVFLSLVECRITALNTEIAEDRSLGNQYRIGHSFVTPSDGAVIADHKAWFRTVVETENCGGGVRRDMSANGIMRRRSAVLRSTPLTPLDPRTGRYYKVDGEKRLQKPFELLVVLLGARLDLAQGTSRSRAYQ